MTGFAAFDVPAIIGKIRGHRMAKCAVENAVWDAEAQLRQTPLWKLLGGHRARVPTYASGSLRRGLTDKQAEQAARILIQKGFKEMKTQMALPGNPTNTNKICFPTVLRHAEEAF
mgnify:CR=1 FL=1